jgi:hypothetical protein
MAGSSDMDAFRKAREAQKRAEEERIKAEREIRQHATARLMSAKAREKEAFAQIVQRLGAFKLRIRPNQPVTILASADRSERKVASDETPSTVQFGNAAAMSPGGHTFNLVIQIRFDAAVGLLRLTLGHESSVGGAKIAPKGLLHEWNDVESFMQSLIQWALSVPEVEAC